MKVIIIGTGPAGLNAAIHASNGVDSVLVIEKNEKPGKKLFITGKGRCNVTNNCSPREFISNVVNNKEFLYSSINNFSSEDTINFFEENKVPLVAERGNRVFPKSYKSYDITDALVKKCKELGVKFQYNEAVTSIHVEDEHFILNTSKATYKADFVVIATGGISYPLTGSTGDGYKFAKRLSHTIIEPVPALVGMKIKEEIPQKLRNFTLKNVSLTVKNENIKYSEFGEMTFFKDYIDGPIVITLSSLINRIKENISLEIDLKPALNEQQLLARINRDIDKNPNMTVKELLKGLMHADFIEFFDSKFLYDLDDKCCNFSNENRRRLVTALKHFELTYTGLVGFDRAVVTSGGVSTKEINPKTMESKIVPNLYFAGEVIDVDAFTGGFNIQIALSTGAIAGDDIASKAY